MFPLAQLVLILFAEAVSSREEIPASLLIHLPYIGLLWIKSNTTVAAELVIFYVFLKRRGLFGGRTWPVCSVSSLLIRYIRKNLSERKQIKGSGWVTLGEECQFFNILHLLNLAASGTETAHIHGGTDHLYVGVLEVEHSQIVGQVVLL